MHINRDRIIPRPTNTDCRPQLLVLRYLTLPCQRTLQNPLSHLHLNHHHLHPRHIQHQRRHPNRHQKLTLKSAKSTPLRSDTVDSPTFVDTPDIPSNITTDEPPDSPDCLTPLHLTHEKLNHTDFDNGTAVAAVECSVHPLVISPSPSLSTPSLPILSPPPPPQPPDQSPPKPPDPVEELNRQISKLNPEMIQWLKDKELI